MAEMHILSFETHIAAEIRRELFRNPEVSRKLFGTTTLGALLQYNPAMRWIEAENGELAITTRTGVPLLRYNTHDKGGVYGFQELLDLLKAEGIEISVPENVWHWPFFFCTGRGDSVSIMGANLYPANIEKFFHEQHTCSDFKLAVEYSEDQRAQFVVHLELRPNQTIDPEVASSEILQLLLANNDDFVDAYSEEPSSMHPKVLVHPYRTGPFSTPQVKQSHIQA